MRLTSEIALAVPPDQLFTLLMDVEQVASCMPGATLEERDGVSYRGKVKVKVGPISTTYRGTVRFLQIDEQARRAVLDARGADEHGSGNAEAKVVAQVQPDGSGSVLSLETDLLIRGRVAQFGRGVLGDISQKLIEQFADNLSVRLANGAAAGPAAVNGAQHQSAAPGPASDVPVSAAGDSAELSGLAIVALPILKRIAPLAAAMAVGFALGVLTRRGRRG